MPLKLKVLETRFTVSQVGEAPSETDCWAVIHDHDGWTIITSNEEGTWKAIQIDQEFGLDEVGVLLQILQPLADAQVPIMAYSSYRTDYVFVKMNKVQAATDALREAGHEVTQV